jgi:hypothetical protein
MAEFLPVRFIGGPRDGEFHPVDATADSLSVPDKALPLTYVRNQPRTTAESTVTYTRRSINLTAGEQSYFAPSDWSNEQALVHLFNP